MKKSLTIMVSVALLVTYFVMSFVSCSNEAGVKNELTKYYQSEWSRLSDNFSQAHFKALILEYMDTMAHCPYPIATEREPIAQKLAAQYCSERLYNDLADMALPHFCSRMSVIELKKVNSDIADEKALAAIKRIADIMQNEFRALIDEQTGNTVAAIMNGEEPVIPTLSEELQRSYLPAMEKFYRVSGRKEIVENSFSAMNEAMSVGAPESSILTEAFFEYINKATPIMMCMTMEGKVSEEELNRLIAIYEQPEFVKLKDANIEYSQEIAKANAGVQEMFYSWLKKKI
ncbi:MAG: hypothetical protein J6J37_00400 [Bacteroidaceae bacterium]|nr:hypothetical protein [Bacteroidaceae bacterium]